MKASHRVTVGTWQIGGSRFGTFPTDRAVALIRTALEARVTRFDTSKRLRQRSRAGIARPCTQRPPRGEAHITAKLDYVTGFDGHQEHVLEGIPSASPPRRSDPNWRTASLGSAHLTSIPSSTTRRPR